MTFNQVIDQLENHLLKVIDDGFDEDFACSDCTEDDRIDECVDTTQEAINLSIRALTLIAQEVGGDTEIHSSWGRTAPGT